VVASVDTKLGDDAQRLMQGMIESPNEFGAQLNVP
jgi:hypothetical protein